VHIEFDLYDRPIFPGSVLGLMTRRTVQSTASSVTLSRVENECLRPEVPGLLVRIGLLVSIRGVERLSARGLFADFSSAFCAAVDSWSCDAPMWTCCLIAFKVILLFVARCFTVCGSGWGSGSGSRWRFCSLMDFRVILLFPARFRSVGTLECWGRSCSKSVCNCDGGSSRFWSPPGSAEATVE
jgi:hypothetical protein